jgi:hypothetical protein
MKWSKNDTEKLKKLYPYYLREEISRDEIIKVFNRSITAISQQAGKLGLTGRVYDRVDVEEYRRQCEILDI